MRQSINGVTDMRYATLALLSLVAGCATAASPPAGAGSPGSISSTETGGMIRMGQDSRAVSVSLDASPDQVWAALPGIYEQLGIQAEMREEATRTIGTRSFSGSRIDGKRTTDFVRCGNQGSGPSSGAMYRTRLLITTRVMATRDGKTDLVTEVGGTATPVEGTSTGQIACASTGDLEQRIRALALQAIAG